MRKPTRKAKSKRSSGRKSRAAVAQFVLSNVDEYWTNRQVCAFIGGRNGGPLTNAGLHKMMKQGRIPRPDIPSEGGGMPSRWRRSTIVKAMRKAEGRAA